MPIYMEISRLYRSVTIIARGTIGPEEIIAVAEQLVEAQVPGFTKLVDVAGATAGVTAGDIRRLAAVLRKVGKVRRGAVAFLIDPGRRDFARAFAVTQPDRPVSLFTSIHQARNWLARGGEAEHPSPAAGQELPPAQPAAGAPWSDPERQAVLIRRGQRRVLPRPSSRPSYAMD
jgi:hypothetical protein